MLIFIVWKLFDRIEMLRASEGPSKFSRFAARATDFNERDIAEGNSKPEEHAAWFFFKRNAIEWPW